MPYYDYKCKKCETQKELFHSINDDTPPCPECGGELVKVFTVAPPDLASGIRVQSNIDKIRTHTYNKYFK